MYAKIETKFWNDPTVRRLNEDARMLFLYILTTPQRNIVGLFHLPAAFACYHLQWTPQRFEKALKELIKANRVKHDSDLELILIKNFFKYQAPENPNQVKASLEKLNELPDTPLFFDLANILERSKDDKFVTVAEGLRNRFETLSKGLAKGSETVSKPETETEADTESESGTGTDSDSMSPGGDQHEQSAGSSEPSIKISASMVNQVKDDYNKILSGLKLEVRVINDARAKQIKFLLKRYGREVITEVFKKVSQSDFLLGRTQKPFNGCDLDWIIDESNFVKIYEGKYDNENHKKEIPKALHSLMEGVAEQQNVDVFDSFLQGGRK